MPFSRSLRDAQVTRRLDSGGSSRIVDGVTAMCRKSCHRRRWLAKSSSSLPEDFALVDVVAITVAITKAITKVLFAGEAVAAEATLAGAGGG